MYHRFKLKLIIADCLTKSSGGGMKKKRILAFYANMIVVTHPLAE